MTKTNFMFSLLLLLAMTLNPVILNSQTVENVSLVQLISNPEKFDGRIIMVVGFLHLEHEGNVLYLHEDDYKNRIYKNGVWVTRNAMLNEKAHAISMHYVLVRGTFDAGNKGHMSLTSGAITKITNVEVWPGAGDAKD